MKTWIFLRGLTRESRHWGDFVAQFEQTLPGSRLVALDLPGNGRLNITSNRAIDEVLPLWLALRLASPVSGANTLRQLVAAARFRAPAVKPLAPTLVLASEQDHLVSVECSKALARHWQCALRLHPSAGHDLPLDDGPWVATQVREWLIKNRH